MVGEFETRFPVLEIIIDKIQAVDEETARRIRTGYFSPQKMLDKIYELHIPKSDDDPWTIIRELGELNSQTSYPN